MAAFYYQSLFYLGFFYIMPLRYTNTDKWSDSWFSQLKQLEMLLFLYLIDNCDCAGFIEVNLKRWAIDLNSQPDTIKGALKGLDRGLLYTKDMDCIYIRNFLKHQRNLPLDEEKNKAHRGIMKRFVLYADKFDIKDVNEFIEGACKGLGRGLCISISKGNGNVPIWKKDFEVYKQECKQAFGVLKNDLKFRAKMENLHPKLDFLKTLINIYESYWSTERGWINKKKSQTVNIDWDKTVTNSFNWKETKIYRDDD